MTTIEIGSIWYNAYQKLEVEITCVKDNYVCYNFFRLSACGYSDIDEFLSEYVLVK